MKDSNHFETGCSTSKKTLKIMISDENTNNSDIIFLNLTQIDSHCVWLFSPRLNLSFYITLN